MDAVQALEVLAGVERPIEVYRVVAVVVQADSQDRWLALLGQCPGVEVYVWRPSDLDEIAEVLRR
jgi:hypothetical protein